MRLDPSTPLAPQAMHLECRVAGCGWAVDLPIVYRLELAPPAPGQRHPGGSAVRLELDVDATLAAEVPLRAHLDEHATGGAPPIVEPPAWPELEWCDEGASCEHPACLDYAREVAEDENRAAAGCGANCERCEA